MKLPSYANLSFISPDKTLKLDDSSTEIKTAEKMLKVLGYNPGSIDGYFDEQMKAAVMEFQNDQKLKATGVLKDNTTLNLMEELRKKIVKNDTQVKAAVMELKKEMKATK